MIVIATAIDARSLKRMAARATLGLGCTEAETMRLYSPVHPRRTYLLGDKGWTRHIGLLLNEAMSFCFCL